MPGKIFKRALISVSDKSNLQGFVKGIDALGIEIISTGGTERFISSLGIKVRPIEELTGFPEMFDGRVKTLHPRVHGALLYLRDKEGHISQLREYGIEPIDMVVVNLYPFKRTIATPGIKLEEAIEDIDIGGLSIIRSAAKNYRFVAVITSPLQYDTILKELSANSGSLSDTTLANLAVEAFRLTADYDSAIHVYLEEKISLQKRDETTSIFPKQLTLKFDKIKDLRYGENPHQKAAFYKNPNYQDISLANARQLHGKELSANNIFDMDAALELVREFERPAAVIVKHLNPCGVATADTLNRAYMDALECDKLSVFGGIVGLNKNVDVSTAEAILASDFIECVIAGGFEQAALHRLMTKPNIRIVATGPLKSLRSTEEFDFRKITGGLIAQERDLKELDITQLKIVTVKRPSAEEVDALVFAWKIAKYVRSNAIVLADATKTVGIGAGQMSRVDSVFMAIHKAGHRAKGAVLASEAFFPKEDALELASRAGITSIIQPGGSKADEKIITFCNQKNISMVFTGLRHFKH